MSLSRLNPKANPSDLIEYNLSLLKRYISSDRTVLKKAEEVFQKMFTEYGQVHHNDQFHGNETLLYHQYMVLHSFTTLMDVVEKDYNDNDHYVQAMRSLLTITESKTTFGRKELKSMLTHSPPTCSKPFQILLFLAVLFHDIGKLYNTEKWEKEFNDETLRLRKFQKHDDYGWAFFQILSTKKNNFDTLFGHMVERTKKEIAKLNSQLDQAESKKKEEYQKKLNFLKIDLHYLIITKDRILEFKDLLDELDLKRDDYWFVSKLVEHHQTLFNDPSMDYAKIILEKDQKKISTFVDWVRKKKLEKVGVTKKTKLNDYIFYGLLFMNMSDTNGTGFSDHEIEYAFKNYKLGDKFEGHHGAINSDAEFFGFLNYMYHNISKANEEIVTTWFGVEAVAKKQVVYNYDNLQSQFSSPQIAQIQLILEKEGPKGLAKNGYNVGQIMKLIRV